MITLREIREAQRRLAGVAIRTPVLPLKYVDRENTFVKCENLQRAGSFKIRGAFNKISRLRKVKGVTAYSSGNHAQGVALAAKIRKIPATIVMLDQSMAHKVEQTKAYGAEVIFGGKTSEAIRHKAEEVAAHHGFTLIPPFNDPEIIAGQGTIGLEILQDLRGVKSVVVPIGGGGLCSGIVTAIKESNPKVKVFGVEPEGAPKIRRSLDSGTLVTLNGTDTIADGLKPVRASELTLAILRKYIDDVVLVSDVEILAVTRHLLQREKLVVEPSGAAGLAGIHFGRIKLPKGPAVAVLSGGNADLNWILNTTKP